MYNPKAEFFLALGTFNKVVAPRAAGIGHQAEGSIGWCITVSQCLENGQPYGGAEFWSLYAGLIEPPKRLLPDGDDTRRRRRSRAVHARKLQAGKPEYMVSTSGLGWCTQPLLNKVN